MNELEELKKKFKKFMSCGCGQYESADMAVKEVFKSEGSRPYIHKDVDENASHIFYDNKVLFFGMYSSSIFEYKLIASNDNDLL